MNLLEKKMVNTLIDLKDWTSGCSGNVQVMYGTSITDYQSA